MQLMVCGTRLVMWLNALIQLHRMLEWARSCRNVLHRSCRNILEILQHVAIYCTVRTIPWCVQLHGAYDCTVCTIEQCAQANGEYNCTVRSIALHECSFCLYYIALCTIVLCTIALQLLVCGKLKRLEMRSNALMRLAVQPIWD